MSLIFLGNRSYNSAYIKPTSNLQALIGISTRTRMAGSNRRTSHPAHGLGGVKCPRLISTTDQERAGNLGLRNCRLSPLAFHKAARAPLFFPSGRGRELNAAAIWRGICRIQDRARDQAKTRIEGRMMDPSTTISVPSRAPLS